MESSQTSKLNNKTEFQRKADSIKGLVGCLNYEFYSSVELETLILLTNHVRVIPSEEIKGFRIVKFTEAWFIFKKLKDAYSTRTMQEAVKELLIEYQHFETLAVLEF